MPIQSGHIIFANMAAAAITEASIPESFPQKAGECPAVMVRFSSFFIPLLAIILVEGLHTSAMARYPSPCERRYNLCMDRCDGKPPAQGVAPKQDTTARQVG
jgi:hypothetical protein